MNREGVAEDQVRRHQER